MSFKSALPSRRAAKIGAVCLAGAVAISLAGCMTETSHVVDARLDDYHLRHPILLTEAPTTLDVFPTGQSKLDPGSVKDVKAFAARYLSIGSGKIVILSPAARTPWTGAAVDEIRRVLASAGVRGAIGLGSYPVADHYVVAPIKLSFRGPKAEVASRCGQWPQDLASGGSLDTWTNQSYWNFGCATQSMLAAQVDDPRDFARSRALGPADDTMQLNKYNLFRNGQDPGTAWKVQLTTIGAVGGN
ncbi:MAG: CpaD family pilus assembly protein [Roseiarcus sp.]|jgi:pilus assembly protein CpaD